MALVTVTSPAVSVSAWLRVICNWLIPSQGRSVFRPAGSSRSPSAAVWSAAVWRPPADGDRVGDGGTLNLVGADIDRAVDDPREAGAALVGGQGLAGGGIDGQGVAAGVDGGAAGQEGDGLGRPAVVRPSVPSPGLATPTWLPLVPLARPPEPPVPIRLYALDEETVPTVPAMSSGACAAGAVGVQGDDRVVQGGRAARMTSSPPPCSRWRRSCRRWWS